MLIHHFNTNQTYELLEENQYYAIKGGVLRETHSKNDLHTAIWDLIDWIRMSNFTNLTNEDCNAIRKIWNTDEPFIKEEVMNIICGKKLNRLFYEHAYDLIYYSFMTKRDRLFVLNNQFNFFLYEEIVQLIKFSTLAVTSKIFQSKIDDRAYH